LLPNLGGTVPGVFAVRADGTKVAFLQTAPGVFELQGDKDATLSVLYSGSTQIGWTLRTADDSVEQYNVDGVLQSITTRQGVVFELLYNATGRLSGVRDSFGHLIGFAWAGSRLLAIIEEAGNVATFTYDSKDRLTSVTYADGTSRQYHYEVDANSPLLTGITDEAAVRFATWSYDYYGRIASSTHTGGVESHQIAYIFDGRRSVTDPLGTVRLYAPKAVHGVNRYQGTSSTCGGCSEDQSVVYGPGGNIVSRTDFRGSSTTYAYESTRNLEISRTEAVGSAHQRTVATTWHPTFRLPTQIVEAGRTT
jgi:YD repeat-containing protein